MDLRKLQTKEPVEHDEEQEEEISPPEKPKRTRKKTKPEKEKSPLMGFLAVVVLVGIGVLFLVSQASDSVEPTVKGARSDIEQGTMSKEASQAATAIQGRFEDRLESIKDRVEDLNSEDVIENSPQVEKIIQDLESLQGLPQREVKKACEAVCEAL